MEFAFIILLVLAYVFGLPALVLTLWKRLRDAERRVQGLEQWRDEASYTTAQVTRDEGPTSRQSEGSIEFEAEERIRPQPITGPVLSDEPETVLEDEAVDEPALAYAAEYGTAASAPIEEPLDGPGRSPFSLANFDFEDIFGRRLAIWAGGITLAISGVLAVRYSIESGLLTPIVRVMLAFLSGAVLLGAAEIAYRKEDLIADERVRQALAGAGLATLYAAFYLAGTQYGLIGQTIAFVGLAAVTAASIALSFRFGLPSAILGLVGGFAAPFLVGGDEANIPVLALYLGLVTGGLCFTGRAQKRAWMGIGALIGGLGWGVLLLLGDNFGFTEILALGLYFIALGAVLPTLVDSPILARPLRAGAAFFASLQLAVLVANAGHEPLAWGLYLLLGATLAWFGWRREDMRIASPVAAVIGVLLMLLWPTPDPVLFAAVGVGIAAIFVGVPLALIWQERDTATEWLMVAAIPAALAATAYIVFGTFEQDTVETTLALATLALASLTAAGSWLVARRDRVILFAGFTGVATALLFAAGLMVTPGWAAPLIAAAVSAIPAYLAHQRMEFALRLLLWIGAGAAFVALLFTPDFLSEVEHLFGSDERGEVARSMLRWGALALPFLALCWLETRSIARRASEIGAGIVLYGFAAQVVPAIALPWLTALSAIALFVAMRERVGGFATWSAITVLWALYPMGQWALAALESLAGQPILLFNLPALDQLALRVLPAAAALAMIRYEGGIWKGYRLPVHWLALPFAIVVVHVLYRHLFAVETMTQFVSLGMAERTVWQAALLAAAWAAARGIPKLGASTALASVLALASLSHFALYSLWWHNPMTADQAVGATPIANLFLAGFAVAAATAMSLRHWLPNIARPGVDGVIMFLATLGTLALLRQIFGGSTPFDVSMTQSEDLLRSLIGIVMALVFLIIGSRLKQRSWRIGSLVVMLIAVMKVFLFDAAGLEGLLRIASFAALGLSLIGLGWFYTRQLKAAAPTS